jgi:DNA invertase Pin-like site-specific DNA recombinase
LRAALYARFSTDLQRAESIADQLAACRAYCAQHDLSVVGEYEDAAISGASMANRAGLAEILQAARAGQFDVLVTEALDRLSRSQGDIATLFEDLRFYGVTIRTLSEGEVEELAIGLKGTMNALFLRETARKTRRGMVGVAREGRHAGGRVYGYRIRREFDASGQLVPGLREIDDAEAEVVREVFTQYAAGLSPRAIAAKLNDRGIAAPRGGQWNASTINGNAARGNGLLHNQLYKGLLVWGRQTWSKSRETGARHSRAAPASNLVKTEVPHLRIVSDELWDAVQGRYASVALGPHAIRPEGSRRPVRLLSGLSRCGACGGPLIIGGADARLVCSVRRERGQAACSNGRGAKSAQIEARVAAAVRGLLLDPAVVEEAVREYQTRSVQQRSSTRAARAKQEAELAEVKRRAERLVDQVADGVLSGAAVQEKLAALELSRATLERELAATPAEDNVVSHSALPQRFRRLVERLNTALAEADTPERLAARDAFRDLIRQVVVTPSEDRGQFEVAVEMEMAALVAQDGHISTMGAGTGFEPVTFRL